MPALLGLLAGATAAASSPARPCRPPERVAGRCAAARARRGAIPRRVGPSADWARHDADRPRLSRLRPIDCDHRARWAACGAPRVADCGGVRARPCRRRRGQSVGWVLAGRCWASGLSSRRPSRPDSSAARRGPIAARRAGSISAPIFPAGSPAAPCSARSLTCRDGRSASPESSPHFSSPPRSQCGS